MKSLFNKVLVCVIGIFTSVSLSVYAQAQASTQLEEKSYPVGEFTALDICDDFEVTVSRGSCSVRVAVDNALSPYVQVYVRSKTLYVSYDEKAVPKDIKKMYKGRGAPVPVFRVYVSLPVLTAVTLSDNAVLNTADEFSGSRFELDMTDKSQVKNLSVAGSSLKVSMKKNSQALLTLRSTDMLEAIADGNSNLKMSAYARTMVVTATGGSSQVNLTGESDFLTLSTAGNSKLIAHARAETTTLVMGGSSQVALTGDSPEFEIKGDKSAELDADDFLVKTLKVSLSGSNKANVSVMDNIEVTLLGGSSLFYTGNPTFRIGKIFKSTLAPKGSSAK